MNVFEVGNAAHGFDTIILHEFTAQRDFAQRIVARETRHIGDGRGR